MLWRFRSRPRSRQYPAAIRETPCGRFLRRNVRGLLTKGCCTFGTCRRVNSNFSANADLGPSIYFGQPCAGNRPFSSQSNFKFRENGTVT